MKYLKLYTNCIFSKGIVNSTVCDLHRNNLYLLPSNLEFYISQFRLYPYEIIIKNLDVSQIDEFNELVNLLLFHELAHLTDHPEFFIDMSMEWDEPYDITNSIVDIKDNYNYAGTFIEQINKLRVHTIQIRLFNSIDILKLYKLLFPTNNFDISSIEIIIPYNSLITDKDLSKFYENIPKISVITIYNAPFDKIENLTGKEFGILIYRSNKIIDKRNCGIISFNQFTINIKTFTESQHHNSCLNRKISIDENGNIKNCPSMAESFGNIRDTTLAEAIEKPGFKRYWDINRDKIYVCKDCEFRYICTDCRAYVEDPGDILTT